MNSLHDVIGHDALQKKLNAFKNQEKVPHALLFVGPKDIGKYRLARHFAQVLNEENSEIVRQIEKNICSDVVTMGDLWQKDKLESWEKIAKTSNFNQVHRTGKNGVPKRTNTIGVEDIHMFLPPLAQSGVAEYKIGIIRDADRMTTEAANALLKTLEEPTKRTLFILTAHHAKSLPETIISRCQVFPLFLHSEKKLLSLFAEKDISESEKKEMLMIAQGRSEVLIRFLEDSSFFEQERRQFQGISQIFFTGDELYKMKMAEDYSKPEKAEDLLVFLENFLRFLRSLLVEKTHGKTLDIAQRISYVDLLNLFAKLDFVKMGLRANANKRMLLEDFFLSIP